MGAGRTGDGGPCAAKAPPIRRGGRNIAVWLGFIAGTEFFVAYQSEGPFRELLVIALLMPVIIAVVPDRIAADHVTREVSGNLPSAETPQAPPGGDRNP
jgi:hypothetical protein